MKRNSGFSLIEIMVALAVFMIVFVGIFHFVSTLYMYREKLIDEERFFSYTYGVPYCALSKDIDEIIYDENNIIDFSLYFSTSTKITSIRGLGMNNFLFTTDSASTSEKDIFIFTILNASNTLISSIDVGPGIQDSKLLHNFLYIANTSVNSHVKTLGIKNTNFQDLFNIKLPTLASSASLPKKVSISNNQLILGSEKSNSGGELFIFPIENDGIVRMATKILELDGQLNQALSAHGAQYIANASDPELRVYTKSFIEEFTYDAPLTLGNGKSILYIHPYIILGRTLGSGELSLFRRNGTTTEVLDIERTFGTVDFMQGLTNELFVAMTAHEDKELQLWSVVDGKLKHQKNINIPGRVLSYTCMDQKLYISILINEQPKLIWLEI